jgi:hypothetical protein
MLKNSRKVQKIKGKEGKQVSLKHSQINDFLNLYSGTLKRAAGFYKYARTTITTLLRSSGHLHFKIIR